MSGYYRMARGWMDHPALGGGREPFCRRAAWAWMIEAASWGGAKVNVRGQMIGLQRGQFTHSLRYMARAWGWPEPRVRRFLERLAGQGMIVCGKTSESRLTDNRSKIDAGTDAPSDSSQLLITLCNYDKYQAAPSGIDAGTDAPSDAKVTRYRRSSDANKKEGKEGKESKRAACRTLGELQIDDLLTSWAAKNTPTVKIELELEKFRDWCAAKGRTFKNYRSAFRNWLRKAQEFADERSGGGGRAEPRRRDMEVI